MAKTRNFDPRTATHIPYLETMAPYVERAIAQSYKPWIRYDFLILALALERYRADHAAYPPTLDELVPDYLERLPREPTQDLAYGYKQVGEEFTLGCPAVTAYGPLVDWTLPNSQIDAPDLHELLREHAAQK